MTASTLASSSSLIEESEPAKSTAPAMNFSRPAPEPSAAYSTAAPELAARKPFIHASWASPWEEAPAPLI